MVKPNLKPNGKFVPSAVWIDEACGMVIEHPRMQSLIKPSLNKTSGTITMISTPATASSKPFVDNMIEYKYWHWFEFNAKKTKLGTLLYV